MPPDPAVVTTTETKLVDAAPSTAAPPAAPPEGLGSWRIRRLYMFVTSGFCKAVIAYVLITNRTGAPADSAMTMSFLLIGAIVTSYVFGGIVDDKNKMQALMQGVQLKR